MADDEQLPPSWEDITGQLSAMNNRWQTELSAGLHREKNLKQRVVQLEVVVTNFIGKVYHVDHTYIAQDFIPNTILRLQKSTYKDNN